MDMGYLAAGAVIGAFFVYRWLRKWQDPQWRETDQNSARFWTKNDHGGV
jgi:hypothetical protein